MAYQQTVSVTDHNEGQTQFRVGDTVKFLAPLTDEEVRERFIVIELRGPRVLVEAVCDMRLRPTFVYEAIGLTAA
jgi:hypothetical protein